VLSKTPSPGNAEGEWEGRGQGKDKVVSARISSESHPKAVVFALGVKRKCGQDPLCNTYNSSIAFLYVARIVHWAAIGMTLNRMQHNVILVCHGLCDLYG